MAPRPLVLLSNDDGFRAPGLLEMRQALAEVADVVVCAPHSEQSASSHSISLSVPLRLREHGPGLFSVDGTPADSVYVALCSHGRVLPRRPDIVVSGINHGLNLAGDVFYSGTVAAAREAALRGFRGIALSAAPGVDMTGAAACGVGIVRAFLGEPLPKADRGLLLNVNFPPGARWRVRATRLGLRSWQWIVNAFTWAREACPNATLILNDYNNIEVANQNQHFIDIVKVLEERGAPIDAVGAQAHGLSGGNTNTMISLLTKLHDDTGLPVYITEYDIDQNDDATQRDRFQQHFSFFLDTEWIGGVTVWGWIFGRTWVQSSGLIRNGTPRPAMVWLMEELGRPVPQ